MADGLHWTPASSSGRQSASSPLQQLFGLLSNYLLWLTCSTDINSVTDTKKQLFSLARDFYGVLPDVKAIPANSMEYDLSSWCINYPFPFRSVNRCQVRTTCSSFPSKISTTVWDFTTSKIGWISIFLGRYPNSLIVEGLVFQPEDSPEFPLVLSTDWINLPE